MLGFDEFLLKYDKIEVNLTQFKFPKYSSGITDVQFVTAKLILGIYQIKFVLFCPTSLDSTQ